MIISSVKIDDALYALDDSGAVLEQLPEDDQFYLYRMRSKVCSKLLYKTINTIKANAALHKEEVRLLKEKLEESQISLRRRSREVRLLKADLCGKCSDKGKEIRAAL